MTVNIILLVLLLLGTFLAVIAPDLLKSAIYLAATSIVLAILMFHMNAPIVAIFELSVCAGLITVIFVSTISLTKVTSEDVPAQGSVPRKKRSRFFRYMWLPVLWVIVGEMIWQIFKNYNPSIVTTSDTNVRNMLWNLRQEDLMGQIIIILVGVFGIVVLFKEKSKND